MFGSSEGGIGSDHHLVTANLRDKLAIRKRQKALRVNYDVQKHKRKEAK